MHIAQPALRGAVSSSVHRRERGLRSLVLAAVLALGSMPTVVWANALSPSSTQVARSGTTSPATRLATPDAPSKQRQEYASREARATGQAKFEGGDTAIWIGGSTLVVVLLVVLIVILL